MSRLTEAQELCVGLMSHDPSDPLRQGYTIGNALIAAHELFSLTATEVAVVADRLVKPLVDAAKTAASQDEYPALDDALEAFGVAR